jgi:dUTP pyrophosphatase
MTIGNNTPSTELVHLSELNCNKNLNNYNDTSYTWSILPLTQEQIGSLSIGNNFALASSVVRIDCELKFAKTHPDAKIPVKNHSTDTGFDVSSIEDKFIPARGSAVVDVGLKFAYITPGFWVKIEGRSGLGFKHGIIPHPGIIDNPYRGSAGIKLYNQSNHDYEVKAGDRIAQFVVYKNYQVSVSEGEVVESERGEKGFGSSGK